MKPIESLKYRVTKLIGERFRLYSGEARCFWCESNSFLVNWPLIQPDFEDVRLPREIQNVMLKARDGVCMSCGLYQRLDRLDLNQLRAYRASMPDKDRTTTSDVFRAAVQYPTAARD